MFARMNIAQRLYSGFGIIILLIVITTIVGINRVNKIDNTLQEIVEVNSVKQRYAMNFRGSVHDRAIAIRDVVLSENSNRDLFKISTQHISNLEKYYEESAKPMDEKNKKSNVFLRNCVFRVCIAPLWLPGMLCSAKPAWKNKASA